MEKAWKKNVFVIDAALYLVELQEGKVFPAPDIPANHSARGWADFPHYLVVALVIIIFQGGIVEIMQITV